MSASLVTSAGTNTAPISFATLTPSDVGRSAMTTLEPCEISFSAVARARPEAPPVTSATMLESIFIRPSSVCRLCGSEPLDDGCVGHAAGFAHGLQAIARAGPFHRVQHGRHELAARSAQRVAGGDRAADRVELV